MPTDVESLKQVTYDQQGIINQASKAPDDPVNQKILSLVKPQYEQNLSLYDKAVKKLKKK